MSADILAAPGPFEPNSCITGGRAPARSTTRLPILIVVVIITAWAVLVVAGVPTGLATAGLAGAASLGMQVAARLTNQRGGGHRA